MPHSHSRTADLDASSFYADSLERLNNSGIEFLVGGAYAFAHYTGIFRDTKDCDLFVRPADCRRVLDLFSAHGLHTELTFPHWLGKVFFGEYFIDVIFSSGNGVATVDDEWFEHAINKQVFGVGVRLCPVEEMIWSKGFIAERERYDGADVMHLLRGCGADLDWRRLLRRFGPNWRVLLMHLVMFGFVYPSERTRIPEWVMRLLLQRLRRELATAEGGRTCQGTLLSRGQYLMDIDKWGYADARLCPVAYMSQEDIDHWTASMR